MRKSIFAAASALMLIGATSASAGVFRPYATAAKNNVGFNTMEKSSGSFTSKALDENGIMTPDQVLEANHIPELEPVGTIFSPKGEHWFYVLETDGDKMDGSSEYYTKWNFKTFKLTVYDGKLNVVGYVHGEANFPEDAFRCNRVIVSSQITSTFFNSNSSDYEVIIGFNYNPDETKYYYGAKQFSQAYTLQSEMPAEPQKSLFECPGLLQGVVNGSTSTTESYLLSFIYESTWDNEPQDKGKVTLRVYKPAGWGQKEPELIARQTTYSGDGEDINSAVPAFVVTHGNDIFSVRTYYEKPLFDYSQGDVPVMTEGNNYIVELYRPSAANPIITDYTDPDAVKAEPWKRVKIPVSTVTSDPSTYIWRSYALGNFMGERDVTWDFSDENGDPCLIISIVDSNVQEESVAFYQVYDLEGNMIKEFGTASNSYVIFPAMEGHSEQLGFEVMNEDGNTVTQLVDWPSLEVKGEIPVLFEYDGNIYTISSVPTRVAGEGGVLYAANALPSMGDGESALSYVVYFNPDGTTHHMDVLRLPEDTAKAYAYVTSEVLDPYLYNTDSKYEYLIWLYSWKDGNKVGTDLSLCVVDNEGKVLAKRQLANGHSNENAFVSNCPDQRFIVLTWRDAAKRDNPDLLELISLPLNKFEGEGTVENPYLIRTYGDLDQVRNNLTSHFALAGNVDCENRAFRPIEGTFLGSIDGRGNTVKNLFVSAGERGALFHSIGQRIEDEEGEVIPEPSAWLKDITFSDVTFYRDGSNIGTKVYSLIAVNAQYAEFNKVSVVNPVVEIAGINVNFGVIANTADNVKFIDCAVKNADINLERGNGLGGIAYDVRATEFRNCYVSGALKGRLNVGGIAGVSNSYPSTVVNAHVNASLEATNGNLGGVIGSNNSRTTIKTSIVEGSLTCDDSVGGIVGNLAAPDPEEPETGFIIENNVVALEAINAGDKPETVHRVAGYTSADEGTKTIWVPNPDWKPGDDDNTETGSYQEVPAEADKGIGVNHVISGIEPFDATEGLATEGTTTAFDAADIEFYAGLGFGFGSDTENPWTAPTFMAPVPVLYFEDALGKSITIEQANYTGAPEEKINVTVEFDGIDPAAAIEAGFMQLGTTDESVAVMTGEMGFIDGSDNRVAIEVELLKEGETEFFVEYNGLRATATITVSKKDGIANVTVNNAITYANGVVRAEGAVIAVFDAQGRQVAAGFGELSTADLAAGLYIVRATAADKTSSLKIAVK